MQAPLGAQCVPPVRPAALGNTMQIVGGHQLEHALAVAPLQPINTIQDQDLLTLMHALLQPAPMLSTGSTILKLAMGGVMWHHAPIQQRQGITTVEMGESLATHAQ